MTPKEKAKELVDKYINFNLGKDGTLTCALIAVDEIINERYHPFIMTDSRYNYWQEVKQEINNL